jgi:hypothetical protein
MISEHCEMQEEFLMTELSLNHVTLDEVEHNRGLAQEYASYSLSRNGLGKMLGGLAGLIVVLAGTWLGAGALTTGLTIGATLAWLLGKEWMRTRIYRSLGRAQENWQPAQRRFHRGLTIYTALVALLVIGVMLVQGGEFGITRGVYLGFVAISPFITWWFLRTALEYIVGVFLLAACAVHSAGGAYTLIPTAASSLSEWSVVAPAWSGLIGALLLIPLGLREHRAYRALTTELRGED